MIKEHKAEIRAGIFALITLVGFGFMIFMFGIQKGYFKPHVTIKTQFKNVYGLQIGVPVRFMGVGIGQVKDILLPKKLPSSGVEVILQIDRSVQNNISRNAIATIKWLSYVTGDTYVEITSGTSLAPIVQDGDSIKGEEPLDYASVLEKGTGILDSLSSLLQEVKKGGLIESLSEVSLSINESVNTFQKGEGLLYSLIYDQKGKQVFENLTETAESLNKLIENIAHGEGLLTSIIYDKRGNQLLGNLTETAESLNQITGNIARGEGTIGALLTDPTVYENLKSLLGGAGRSFILRTLIRKSIEKGKEEE
ncbi:MAG: MlaD family protein [Candidatus Brocadiaceae bacterium]|nr:MlaD family protein [Candidatus Brocadiaceae bacterium]